MITSGFAAPPSDMTDTVVEWKTAARPVPANPRVARLGIAVAASICTILAVYAALTQPTGGGALGGGWGIAGFGGLFTAAALGFPGATFMAWHLGPRLVAASRRRALGYAGVMAAGTILVSDAIVAAWFMISVVVQGLARPAASAPWELAAGFLVVTFQALAVGIFAFVVGLIVIGGPVLVLVVPSALVWAIVVRVLAGHATIGAGG